MDMTRVNTQTHVRGQAHRPTAWEPHVGQDMQGRAGRDMPDAGAKGNQSVRMKSSEEQNPGRTNAQSEGARTTATWLVKDPTHHDD